MVRLLFRPSSGPSGKSTDSSRGRDVLPGVDDEHLVTPVLPESEPAVEALFDPGDDVAGHELGAPSPELMEEPLSQDVPPARFISLNHGSIGEPEGGPLQHGVHAQFSNVATCSIAQPPGDAHESLSLVRSQDHVAPGQNATGGGHREARLAHSGPDVEGMQFLRRDPWVSSDLETARSYLGIPCYGRIIVRMSISFSRVGGWGASGSETGVVCKPTATRSKAAHTTRKDFLLRRRQVPDVS